MRDLYTYEELLSDPLPLGVDATKLEDYLADDEFEKMLKMNRATFKKLPIWKRENLKREVYLF